MERSIIAVSFGYWGKGKDVASALKQLKRAGGTIRKKHVLLLNCPEDAYIDNYGSTCWKACDESDRPYPLTGTGNDWKKESLCRKLHTQMNNLGVFFLQWGEWESNPRPTGYKPVSLPTELSPQQNQIGLQVHVRLRWISSRLESSASFAIVVTIFTIAPCVVIASPCSHSLMMA